MKLGIWLPIFGGWLRNRPEEGMSSDFNYSRQVAQKADRLGFSTILVAELNLNDIKGAGEPVLEAWTTISALAAVTDNIRLMAAIRPGYRLPAIVAKMAANIDQISGGRFEINLVSAWWRREMEMYTGSWLDHSSRYSRSSEFIQILQGMWKNGPEGFSLSGDYYQVNEAILSPKPVQVPGIPIFAGGESDAGRNMIAQYCDSYLMHGDEPDHIARNIADMNERRAKFGDKPLSYGMAAYMICRETEEEAERERKSITDVDQSPEARHSYQDFIQQSQLKTKISIEDYSVSNRGLRPGLVGTPEQIIERIKIYESLGLDTLLIQASPMLEELDRIGTAIIPHV
ncbi:LLM class flavin-dependent oxidoreductase [Pseudobacteriovorax antillogorgiicola]|uniref:FMNH2-dependent dimethyl sulfone monooxygenase n=1 Tax=Pseudobacteriovorax antillogorgiicola TaxID=1513793 RepID=A0A1Y6BX72_9BACT|nr:LLM class flavin-dependent oxidoreductase [Pseudobacteriovorax antillogorgiicola]TCS52338.1 FMNH2-dependent dimethyl sulfone monooxygenase [Pseudobacteriovorax antillogorgiicola]SMF29790.1 FMNH2-dependent dimethyl sulfone monooxygenase [Pseudobacteriovorax antillogorgiicola]